MSLPSVSVIIPAHNHELFVEETLRSVFRQEYQNIELIVIDDGSIDNTLQIINKVKANSGHRFNRFVVCGQKNSGITATLNSLLSQVRGDYVQFCASDDFLEPSIVRIFASFLANNPDYNFVVGDNYFVDEGSCRVAWNSCGQVVPLGTPRSYATFCQFLQKINQHADFKTNAFGTYASLLLGNYIPNGFMIRTSALTEIGGFKKEAPLEDWYLVMQIAKLGKLKYLDECLYNYRSHATNTIKKHGIMDKYFIDTLKYEIALVAQSKDEKMIELAEAAVTKNKKILSMCSYILVYFRKRIDKYYLCILVNKHDYVVEITRFISAKKIFAIKRFLKFFWFKIAIFTSK
ncbi:MAG TPA: glycosyltransferase [Desulfovibrio sp.]|uniref:glycosyltransferase family 2 protein n=1 Tax=Desulfovibrio sp. TaxID=885 RepID=UPI002D759D12|nr:glycosyltransferase [Desulfovibrio sp.]HZF62230.1 glycosyltransferase [Desulfovibrio sp.]